MPGADAHEPGELQEFQPDRAVRGLGCKADAADRAQENIGEEADASS
jgi:hypothetical protein